MTDGENEALSYAVQLVTGSVLPMALTTALELDLLEIIAKNGPGAFVSASELASQLPRQHSGTPDLLDRILRCLASHSILKSTIRNLPNGRVERLYGLAPVCEYLIKNSHGVSQAPLAFLNQSKAQLDAWCHLKDAVLDGGVPFDLAHGTNVFDYSSKDQRYNKIFYQAMFDNSVMTMLMIVENCDSFDGITTIVDVGGGTGASLKMILSKHPTIKGINYDLPHVIEHAEAYAGIDHVAGDMLVSVPKANAIFMKNVLHDWNDECCLKILKNCYEALPDNGKVISVEIVLPEAVDTSTDVQNMFHVDLMMLLVSTGRERTEKQFEALAKQAGFRGFRKVCLAIIYSVMELIK